MINGSKYIKSYTNNQMLKLRLNNNNNNNNIMIFFSVTSPKNNPI